MTNYKFFSYLPFWLMKNQKNGRLFSFQIYFATAYLFFGNAPYSLYEKQDKRKFRMVGNKNTFRAKS
ncbi:MAG: hypothetical protein DRR16_11680 [Candidatus Parabeggiatoa sp. nov. 3]|nr:MAG: hypothetical protein DRQ99_00050 [Gammaproteobacteria bacterium]RKZ85598.1 MAG: hypothetical protein DRR16_11680 [Gammaproteobacteria bacterium]